MKNLPTYSCILSTAIIFNILYGTTQCLKNYDRREIMKFQLPELACHFTLPIYSNDKNLGCRTQVPLVGKVRYLL